MASSPQVWWIRIRGHDKPILYMSTWELLAIDPFQVVGLRKILSGKESIHLKLDNELKTTSAAFYTQFWGDVVQDYSKEGGVDLNILVNALNDLMPMPLIIGPEIMKISSSGTFFGLLTSRPFMSWRCLNLAKWTKWIRRRRERERGTMERGRHFEGGAENTFRFLSKLEFSVR